MKKKGDSLKGNIFANFLIRLWSVISNFIFVPLYIKFLGEEAYGLVTFFSTLQTIMNLLGMGLSKTLRREFASLGNSNRAKVTKYKLLRSVETVYYGIAALIICLCYFGSKLIVTKWLSVEQLSIDLVANTISLMGVSIAIQLITGMLQGCLFGLEKQVEADIIQFGWSFLRNVGVILLLWLFSIDLISFYLWYIFIDIIYCITLRIRVKLYLKNEEFQLKWRPNEIQNIKSIWKYALGLFLISVCTIGFDKIIISKSFDLTTVGAYNTVVMLGNFSLIISTSVGIAVFSRFAILKSEGKIKDLNQLYCNTNKVVNICVGCLGGFIAVFSTEIVLFWTQSLEIANIVNIAAKYIIIGLTFQALQQISYEYMLSTGIVKVDNLRAVITVLALLFFMPAQIKKSGFMGAAISVCVVFSVISIVYVGIVNKSFIGRNPGKAIVLDLVLPVLIPTIVALGIHAVALLITDSIIVKCIIGILGGALTLGTMLLLSTRNVDLKSVLKRS